MPLRRITEPTANCISVDECKDFLRIQGTTADDAMLQGCINAAERYCENYTKRALRRQQWELRINLFPGTSGEIELPRPPLSTASTDLVVSYVEDTTAGNTTSIATTALEIDYYSEPAKIYPAYDNEWPDNVRDDQRNAVRITYYSGYNNTAIIPQDIKHWLLQHEGINLCS
jgi:uncharacterized phiE125 gp8 family phage protein